MQIAALLATFGFGHIRKVCSLALSLSALHFTHSVKPKKSRGEINFTSALCCGAEGARTRVSPPRGILLTPLRPRRGTFSAFGLFPRSRVRASIKKKAPEITLRLSAVRKGLEPSTSGVTGPHSNQLNYRTGYFAVVFQT